MDVHVRRYVFSRYGLCVLKLRMNTPFITSGNTFPSKNSSSTKGSHEMDWQKAVLIINIKTAVLRMQSIGRRKTKITFNPFTLSEMDSSISES